MQEWAGERLTPPMDARRFDELQPMKATRFELEGCGWDEACALACLGP